MTTAGVFIVTQIHKDIHPNKIAIDLFGQYTTYESKWKSGFDIRNKNHKIISIYENGIEIRNSEFVSEFLENRNILAIKTLYEMFEKPETIFAYMNYGSGGSFGFCYIRNGYIQRTNYNLSGDRHYQEGTPFKEEVNFMNSKYYLVGNDEEEYIHFDNEIENLNNDYYYSICEYITPKIMQKILGFNYYTEDVKRTDHFYYYSPEKANSPDRQKSWIRKLFS